jgi:hypothetical protein
VKERFLFYRIDMNGTGIPIRYRMELSIDIDLDPAPAPIPRAYDTSMRACATLDQAVLQLPVKVCLLDVRIRG